MGYTHGNLHLSGENHMAFCFQDKNPISIARGYAPPTYSRVAGAAQRGTWGRPCSWSRESQDDWQWSSDMTRWIRIYKMLNPRLGLSMIEHGSRCQMRFEATEMDGSWGMQHGFGLAVLTSTAQETVPSWAAGGVVVWFPIFVGLGVVSRLYLWWNHIHPYILPKCIICSWTNRRVLEGAALLLLACSYWPTQLVSYTIHHFTIFYI